jgi:hypothetical protein
MATRGKSQTPNLHTEASPPIQQIKRIYRKPEETTPIDDFRRFSETNHEPKGVEYLNHGFSQALHRLLSIHIQAPFLQLSLIGSHSGFMILLEDKPYYRL